jgi:hypothetical protein
MISAAKGDSPGRGERTSTGLRSIDMSAREREPPSPDPINRPIPLSEGLDQVCVCDQPHVKHVANSRGVDDVTDIVGTIEADHPFP